MGQGLQVDLTPFLPGGFMEKWLSLISIASPDTVKDNPTAVKILGSCVLNTFTRACSYTEPIKFGNMLLLLTGPRRSAKSWLTGLIEDLLNLVGGPPYLIPHGTPEAVAENIGKLSWGFVTANEAGEIVTNADNKGYMSTWGFLINKIYMLESIQMARRKRGKTVFVPGRGYYVSLLMNALPSDITTLFEHWRGLERRFIPLFFRRTPRGAWKPDPSRAGVVGEMVLMLRQLAKTLFVVDLPPEPISELGSRLDKEDRDAPEEVKALNDARWEYTIKITMSVFIDRAAGPVLSLLYREGERRGEGMVDERCKYVILPATDYSDTPLYREPLLNEHKPDVVVELSPLSPAVREVMVTLSPQLAALWRQLVTGVAGLFGFDGKIAGRVSEMLEEVKSKGCVRLRDLYRGPLKPLMKLREIGGVKGLWARVLGPLEAAGQIIIRRWSRDQVFILDPRARLCGSCSRWGTELCPHGDVERGVFPDPREEPCEAFVWEEAT